MLSSRRGRTISRNDAKTFPLPDDFFPEVKLSEEQIQNYEVQVARIVQSALIEYEQHEAKGAHPIYGDPWVSVGSVGPLTAYRQETPAGLSHSEFRMYGRIQGNYRSFMDFYYAETSEELFEWNQFMYGYAVDAIVLKNIHTKDSEKAHEYMGIKWTCLQPSAFGHKRDNCFLEYLTYTKDVLGRNVGVRVTLPVEIEECPELYQSLRIKRIKSHSVAIVRPAGSSSDATQLFVMSENDFAGLSVRAKNLRKVMRIYNDMVLFVDSKHISKQGMMNKTHWVASDSRKSCTSCQLPFNAATRRRYHCRLCGEVFCHHCVIGRKVPRDNNDDNKSRVFQMAKSHFCKACLSSIRQGNDSQMSASGFVRASSATHVSSAGKLSSEGNELTLNNAVSNTSDHTGSWDPTASQWPDWSDTDSEAGQSRLESSLSSSQSSWIMETTRPDDTLEEGDMAFVAVLDVLDEKPQRSKMQKKLSSSGRYSMSRKKSTRKQQKSLPSIETQGITEVIDTSDMMTMSELQEQSRADTSGVVLPQRKVSKRRSGREAMASSSGPCPGRSSSRDESANRFKSSRSISQCLAEQEELLRCMLSASQVRDLRSKRRVEGANKVDFASTMPLPRSAVQLYEI